MLQWRKSSSFFSGCILTVAKGKQNFTKIREREIFWYLMSAVLITNRTNRIVFFLWIIKCPLLVVNKKPTAIRRPIAQAESLTNISSWTRWDRHHRSDIFFNDVNRNLADPKEMKKWKYIYACTRGTMWTSGILLSAYIESASTISKLVFVILAKQSTSQK